MRCFHCHEPIPAGFDLTVPIGGIQRPMCCHGCAAVAELIAVRGLGQFYQLREAPARKPDDESRSDWSFYDRPALAAEAGRNLGEHTEFLLALSGVNCAACSWLIESALMTLDGLVDLTINPATARVRVVLDLHATPLSSVLSELDRLGYRPRLLADDQRGRENRDERRAALKRLVVAGFGMMQVMTYAVALYAGYFQDMTEPTRDFFRLVSLVVATPVVLYSGWPFLHGAWRGIRHRRPGMDVPVAIAILAAYLASGWNTFIGNAEVYFDSAVMFVFLLSITRWMEMGLRHRAAEAGAAGADGLPMRALRHQSQGLCEVATTELEPGDRIRVSAGEVVPVDGRLASGRVECDESLLSGESRPVRKSVGQQIMAGSLLVTGPAELTVIRTGRDTLLSSLQRLMERARADRPRQITFADRLARYLVLLVLATTAATAVLWWQLQPERAFETALAVLVITCPCALSLATPATLSAAMAGLARQGILVVRTDALETLAEANRVVFDKTGTLTSGRMRIAAVECRAELEEPECRAIAAALEQSSRHPIATAFAGAPRQECGAEAVVAVSGKGIEGDWRGRRYRVGHPAFVAELSGGPRPDTGAHRGPVVALGDNRGVQAVFYLQEDLRPDAARTIAGLGAGAVMLSGDAAEPVGAVASRLPLGEARHGQTPEDKLEYVRACQAAGETVVMVGDGCNDAPVMAQSDVSVAIGTGSALAGREAAVIVVSDRLQSLGILFRTAGVVRWVIRQNLAWALAYNCTAIPLAATGLVAPWLAAAGMSASSLLVVANSLRASRLPTPRRRQEASILPRVAT